MKYRLYNLAVILGQLNQRHIQLVLIVLSLVLLVIGSGAPADFSGH